MTLPAAHLGLIRTAMMELASVTVIMQMSSSVTYMETEMLPQFVTAIPLMKEQTQLM